MAVSRADLLSAHRHSNRHANEIAASSHCGCFHCGAVFRPVAIAEWVDGDDTAMCPRCGVDAVIGSASGFPVADSGFLRAMRMHWFGVGND